METSMCGEENIQVITEAVVQNISKVNPIEVAQFEARFGEEQHEMDNIEVEKAHAHDGRPDAEHIALIEVGPLEPVKIPAELDGVSDAQVEASRVEFARAETETRLREAKLQAVTEKKAAGVRTESVGSDVSRFQEAKSDAATAEAQFKVAYSPIVESARIGESDNIAESEHFNELCPELSRGDRVQLAALKKRPDLNGEAGIISKLGKSQGRFSVVLDKGGTFEVSLKNIVRVP
jgi:hypothetical protein